MKVLPASAQAVLFAGILSSCSHLSIDSVRANYIDSAAPAVPGQPPTPPKLDVKCMTLTGADEAEVNSRLKALYDMSWRIAASGSHGMDIFMCFERPAGIIDPDVPPPHHRHHAAAAPPPPPPPAATDASSDDSAPPKPRPPRHRPALDADTTTDDSGSTAAPPPSDDSSSSDSDSPPPKKHHRPPPPPDDSGN